MRQLRMICTLLVAVFFNAVVLSADSLAEEIELLKKQMARQEQAIARLLAELSEMRQRLERAAASQAPPAAPAPASLQAADSSEKVRYKNVWLSPGGFVEVAAVLRSRNMNSDLATPHGAVPLTGTANSHLTEFRGSARHSRLSLLAETQAGQVQFSGYFESDFLGASLTSSQVQSNSFNLRLRQFWGHAELPRGFSLTGGQSWSLLATHRQGLRPRSEFIPLTIDPQYAVGYSWARQMEVRLAKDFGGGVQAALAVANPETSVPGVVLPAGILGFNSSPNAQSPSANFTTTATPGSPGVSTNVAPDLIAKVVWEPGWGHWELKGLGRFFHDRLNNSNHATMGGGVGWAALMPLHRTLQLQFQGLAGAGIGRYGAATGGPDVAVSADGAIHPIRAVQTLGSLEWRPTRAWDVYAYSGLEYYDRTSFPGGLGFGSSQADLSGCTREVPANCPQANRTVWQVQPGFWYRLHSGKEGTVALGMSYAHTQRRLWSGAGGARPRGLDNIWMSAIRYYLP